MAVGRPTDYDPKYCEMVIKHMSEGLSFESFAGVVNSTKKTIYSWREKHPEFLNAVEEGFAKCHVFWEKLGVEGLWNVSSGGGVSRSMNSTMWTFNMKNRFGWRDQIDLSSREKKTITMKYPRKKSDADE